MQNDTLSVALARWLVDARAAIPDDVRRKARLHIVDSIGIAMAARHTALAAGVARAQAAATGSGNSPLLCGGDAAPLASAFINGALIHIQDYDDIHDEGRLHPSAVIAPVVLAVSGMVTLEDDDFVDAVVLGNELICRLGKAWAPKGEGPGSEWFLTQLFGYVAGSVAASVALGLTAEQTVSAIGLAYMQAAGGKQAGFGTGANARAIYPAFAAQGGLQAALLARDGLIGPEGALDGAAGLFPIYMGTQATAQQNADLCDASHWHFRDVELKPWPSCRLSHPYIAVALAARAQAPMAAETRIRLAVNASAARLCRPLEQRRTPRTLQDAKYSIPFMTAFTLLRGAPSLSNLNEEALGDAEVLATAARIELDETLPDNPGHPQAILSLHTTSAEERIFRFSPSDLTMDEASACRKFESCLEHARIGVDGAAAWLRMMDGDIGAAIADLCRRG